MFEIQQCCVSLVQQASSHETVKHTDAVFVLHLMAVTLSPLKVEYTCSQAPWSTEEFKVTSSDLDILLLGLQSSVRKPPFFMTFLRFF